MMPRHVAFAFAALVALLVSAPARADVIPFASCVRGPRPQPMPCQVASFAENTSVTCSECVDSDAACRQKLEGAGYTAACSRPAPDGGAGTSVWCKGTGHAMNAQPGGTLPIAGVLMAGSVWASGRLRRRRKS